MGLLDIIMYACAAVGAVVIAILGILFLTFPKEMKIIGTLANDTMNLGFARQSAYDIGAAIGGPIGSILTGILLGLMGVWILLKTGSLQKINEFGRNMSGVPAIVARALAGILFPAVIVGVLAVGIVKLDINWTITAIKAYFNFLSQGTLFRDVTVDNVKFV
jgi:hypothetical protein